MSLDIRGVIGACKAESAGYTCIREAGHGMLHVSPEQITAPNVHGNAWILIPHGRDEEEGRKPMTGYLHVTDKLMRLLDMVMPLDFPR